MTYGKLKLNHRKAEPMEDSGICMQGPGDPRGTYTSLDEPSPMIEILC